MAAHRTALVLLATVLLVWIVLVGLVLERARPDGPSLVAVFQPGTTPPAVMAAVTRADGVLVRETWWPWAFVVHGDDPAFGERLRTQGAVFVLPGGPFRLTMLGGCGFAIMPILDFRAEYR